MFARHYECEICGKPLDRYHRSDKSVCSPTCRKRKQRKKENHEKEMKRVTAWINSLGNEDLHQLRDIISQKLENL